jgi:hypothetical protein
MKKSSQSKKSKKEKSFSKGVQKTVRDALKKIEPLKTHEYDGVLGMLPDWVPEPEKRKFYTARTDLFEEYSTKEIHRLMDSQTKRLRGGFLLGPNMTPKIEGKIDTLNYIKKLVSLGENKALKIILGKERFEHQSRGKKTLNSAKMGHVATHGTKQEKKERWGEYQIEVNALHVKKPNLNYASLCMNIANKFGVSEKTIQRRTTNPLKK